MFSLFFSCCFAYFIFFISSGSLARARKNAKLLVEGGVAQDDHTTDYSKPRKRKIPRKLRESSDDEPPPHSRKRIGKAPQIISSSDSDAEVPSPNTDLEKLQAKLDRAIALRQLTPKTKEPINNSLKTIVKLSDKSGQDKVTQKGEFDLHFLLA